MKHSLKEYLEDEVADSNMIQQATRYYVNEISDYPTTEEMRNILLGSEESREVIGELLAVLETDDVVLEDASLVILSNAWQSGDKELIKDKVKASNKKFPVIDPSALALITIFGLLYLAWLNSPDKPTTTKTRVTRKPDGSFEEVTEATYFPSPLDTLSKLNLFKIFGLSEKGKTLNKPGEGE